MPSRVDVRATRLHRVSADAGVEVDVNLSNRLRPFLHEGTKRILQPDLFSGWGLRTLSSETVVESVEATGIDVVHGTTEAPLWGAPHRND